MCVFIISPVPITEPLTSELIDTPFFYNLAPRPIKYRVSVPIPSGELGSFLEQNDHFNHFFYLYDENQKIVIWLLLKVEGKRRQYNASRSQYDLKALEDVISSRLTDMLHTNHHIFI